MLCSIELNLMIDRKNGIHSCIYNRSPFHTVFGVNRSIGRMPLNELCKWSRVMIILSDLVNKP